MPVAALIHSLEFAALTDVGLQTRTVDRTSSSGCTQPASCSCCSPACKLFICMYTTALLPPAAAVCVRAGAAQTVLVLLLQHCRCCVRLSLVFALPRGWRTQEANHSTLECLFCSLTCRLCYLGCAACSLQHRDVLLICIAGVACNSQAHRQDCATWAVPPAGSRTRSCTDCVASNGPAHGQGKYGPLVCKCSKLAAPCVLSMLLPWAFG